MEFCISNRDSMMIDFLNQFTEITPCYVVNSPNSGMCISGISLSGMSISDSNSLSHSSSLEASSMDIDLSKSQEMNDLGVGDNMKRLSIY